MQSRDENTHFMSPTKRFGVSLNIDTGYRKPPDPSMLDTPVARRPNGPRRSSTRETFLDDITPVDPGKEAAARKTERDSRDSHDLSLSPRNFTRDSLVDNMLLSLDQLSFSTGPPLTQEEANLYSTFAEGGGGGDDSSSSPRVGRGGSRHNQSYSSDYDTADEGPRYSNQYARGRRSNSATNFPAGMGRGLHSANGSRTQGTGRSHTQRKDSKGSSVNSIDMGYPQGNGNSRWVSGNTRRSSSFDQASDRSMFDARPHHADQMPSSYEYEAAPTPTVPVGPRRTRPLSPGPEISSLSSKGVSRKRSIKSSRQPAGSRPDTAATTSAQKYGLHDNARELPPLPAFNSTQSSPKANDSHSQAHSVAASPPTSRPGFFRRVFGSSKNIAAAAEPTLAVTSPTSAEPAERTPTKQQNAAPPSRPETPPSRQAMRPNNQPAVLQKKPSSFFRRRKKSFSEPAPMPQVPLPTSSLPPPITTEALSLGVLPSPVSSLRQVMNPYLDGPANGSARSSNFTHKRQESSSNLDETVVRDLQLEEAKGFSPGYKPNKDATIRPVRSVSPSRTRPSTAEMDRSHSESQLAKESTNGTGASFLQDGSDTDYLSSPELKRNNTTHSRNAASDVARDIALVAEYERTHSKKKPSVASKITDGDELILLAPAKDSKSPVDANRVRIEPTASEESLAHREEISPLQETLSKAIPDSATSPTGMHQLTTSLPLVQLGDGDANSIHEDDLMSPSEAMKMIGEGPIEPIVVGEPTEGDRERAQKVYDGNEDFIQQSKAAAWLGGEGPAKSRTLIAYMDLYDFSNLNILAGLRKLCGRLSLRAESQQVDRILDVFAQRWCASNPNHGFKVVDVVHTICYSILLLNTDLHMADIEQKMTKSQFVKNTMPTIRHVVMDVAPDAFESTKAPVPGARASVVGMTSLTHTDTGNSDTLAARVSIEGDRPNWRSSFKPPPRADGQNATPLHFETPSDDCGPLVKSPFIGSLRTWEVQLEIVLKDFYNSIRAERLPLFGANDEKPNKEVAQSTLSVFANGMLRRTPSVISKSPSETHSYVRARTSDGQRLGTGKWGTKNRSRPRVYPSSTMGSSRTSLDDQSSMWSPSGNSSRYSLGKTHTSMSVDSFGSNWQGDYQQSIGFANALSQAIIREETIGSAGSNTSEDLRVAPLLEDESLGLAGAPWAKEGIVKHKHHLEAVEKKAKHRDWVETFVVIEKGYMSLFSFSTKSTRNKSKGKVAGGVVGGGNWQDNAEQLGQFLLRQTIASALPSPGYSKARPHVFALSLPTGAVHLFQVGTPEIVKEFVSTANYWSARLSNHPLVGGISNIEYGWSDAIVNIALINNPPEATRTSTSGRRPSLHGSMRGSLDHGSSMRARLPGDKVMISDWTPPTQSMRASNLMEQDQLNTLLAYVHSIEDELQKHNQLRGAMILAFSPRHPNGQKAMNNWEKKSSYLLREIVKFRTYIDCLQAADSQKQKIYAERAVAEGSGDEEDGDVTLRP